MEIEGTIPTKKPYTSPTLWVHGGIEELTQLNANMGAKTDTRGKASDTRTA